MNKKAKVNILYKTFSTNSSNENSQTTILKQKENSKKYKLNFKNKKSNNKMKHSFTLNEIMPSKLSPYSYRVRRYLL